MTVDAILIATEQLLIERGYDKTTTNQVAKRAGVSIGSLYQYFPNKEALVTALCERHMQAMAGMLLVEVAGLRTRPLHDAIHGLVRALLRAHAVAPALHRVLIEQVPRLSGFDRLVELDRMLVGAIRHELECRPERLRPKDLDLAVFILVHSVQAVTHAAVLERPDELADEALASETADLVLRYLLD